jgi:hypothetical protein
LALLEATIFALAFCDSLLFALTFLGALGFEHTGFDVAAFDVVAFDVAGLRETRLGLAVGALEVAVVASPRLGDTEGCLEAVGPRAKDEAAAPEGDAGAGPEDGEGADTLLGDAGGPTGTTALGVGLVVVAVFAVVGAVAPTVVGVEAVVVVDVEVRSGLVVPAADVGVSLGALAIPGKDSWYAASDCGAFGRYTRLSGATE